MVRPALDSIVSIWIGIQLIIVGGFGIGTLYAYLTYKAQFL